MLKSVLLTRPLLLARLTGNASAETPAVIAPISMAMPQVIQRGPASYFWLYHLLMPLVVFLVSNFLIQAGDINHRVAAFLYHLEGDQWRLRNAWITGELLHRWGRYLSVTGSLSTMVCLFLTYMSNRWRPHRRLLLFVTVSLISSVGLVGLLKATLATSCPWDFTEFGGALPYRSILQQIISGAGVGCFPAAHAAAGYAWVALYFAGVARGSRWRWAGLGIGLIAGACFGIAQQLRGAHFISHDLWSLAICWMVALGFFRLFFSQQAR